MKSKLKINISGNEIYGSYYDADLLNNQGDTVYFQGEIDGNEITLQTSDSFGERESLSVNLTMRDNNGLAMIKRHKKLKPTEAIMEVLNFKTFN